MGAWVMDGWILQYIPMSLLLYTPEYYISGTTSYIPRVIVFAKPTIKALLSYSWCKRCATIIKKYVMAGTAITRVSICVCYGSRQLLITIVYSVPGRVVVVLVVFFHPIYYTRHSFLSIRSRILDPGSHSRLVSPPTHYRSCLAFFIARRFQLFPRRIASNCAYPR